MTMTVIFANQRDNDDDDDDDDGDGNNDGTDDGDVMILNAVDHIDVIKLRAIPPLTIARSSILTAPFPSAKSRPVFRASLRVWVSKGSPGSGFA